MTEERKVILAERQREYREKLEATGGKQIAVNLDAEDVAGIDAMMRNLGIKSRTAAVKVAVQSYLSLLRDGRAI